MKLLTPKQRQELIERVALRYHEKGMAELEDSSKTIQQYLPLFHYTIFAPSRDSHIFVTELFANNEYQLNPPGNRVAQRLQYHGNYRGLNAVVCQFIGSQMIAPENLLDKERTEFGRDLKLNKSYRNVEPRLQVRDSVCRKITHPMTMEPSFIILGSGKNLEKNFQENFDKSLIYLYETINLLSDPLSLRDINGAQIASTYYVS